MRVATGWSDNAPLVGDIYLNMSRLYWLELFSPDLVRPTGLLEGHVSLRGYAPSRRSAVRRG